MAGSKSAQPSSLPHRRPEANPPPLLPHGPKLAAPARPAAARTIPPLNRSRSSRIHPQSSGADPWRRRRPGARGKDWQPPSSKIGGGDAAEGGGSFRRRGVAAGSKKRRREAAAAAEWWVRAEMSLPPSRTRDRENGKTEGENWTYAARGPKYAAPKKIPVRAVLRDLREMIFLSGPVK